MGILQHRFNLGYHLSILEVVSYSITERAMKQRGVLILICLMKNIKQNFSHKVEPRSSG